MKKLGKKSKSLHLISFIFLLVSSTLRAQTPTNDNNNTNNSTCLVDRCVSCPSEISPTCFNCKPGYYIRNFEGTYTVSQCWSSLSLWLYILLGIIALVVSFLACYGCFYLGKTGVLETLRNTEMEPKEFPEELFYEDEFK